MAVLKISHTFLMRVSVNANLGHLIFSRSERTTKLLSTCTASSVMSKIHLTSQGLDEIWHSYNINSQIVVNIYTVRSKSLNNM